ncbi:MAG: putative protein kinase [Streblomastix strix]|uniref:Protein kinase domain-containing protein n=1 Tax=Streblomastix strix TaxID=222440 RepID=A0A5J4WFZ2_9EUKA|nr:MAG: putative protein kinase [Streblomastix strix]
MEYSNLKTLDIIAKQPHIHLPTYTLRALMKQILEGMKAFHSTGLIHRDIKCDNILLHSPPGSGRVHAKISDFGFAKKEDRSIGLTYLAGTLPYMASELFQDKIIVTQKVDLYATGVTFYRLLTHKYPINCASYEEQKIKIARMKSIERHPEIKDNLLWDLISKLLEFDPNKRITSDQALQHPYFTSPEAIADISKEQQDLASLAAVAQLEGDSSITEFDKEPSFIRDIVIVNLFIRIQNNKQKCEQALNLGIIDLFIGIMIEYPRFKVLKQLSYQRDIIEIGIKSSSIQQ